MTLFADIAQVHDGAAKAPPLKDYLDSKTKTLFDEYWKTRHQPQYNHEAIYNSARNCIVELLRVMGLASAEMEKAAAIDENDLSGLTDAEDVKKAKEFINESGRTLHEIVNHDENEKCTTCAEDRKCLRTVTQTWCTNWKQKEPDYLDDVIKLLDEFADAKGLRKVPRGKT